MQPGVELFRLGLALVVELEGDVGVEADAEVVVHDEDLRVVLALLRVCRHDRAVRGLRLAGSIGRKKCSLARNLIRKVYRSFRRHAGSLSVNHLRHISGTKPLHISGI